MGSSRTFWAKYRQCSGPTARNPECLPLLTYRPVIGEVVPAEKGKGMSLARAEGPFQQGATAAAGGGSAVVIAVAPRAEERLRLAQMIGDHASVVLVGTRAEAIAVLLGELPGLPEKQEPMFGVPPAAPTPVARHGPVIVDSDLRIATWEGGRCPLSPLEHDVLCCLLAELGHTWPFEALHRQVWGNDHLGDRSDVQSVVKRLRRKLRELGCPTEIQAVRGVGIRLVDRRRRSRPPRRRIPRLAAWTSTRRTTRGSPGSRRARCRWRSPTRRPTRAPSSSRRAPATTTASRWRSSPSCRCAATPSTTCSSRTPCWSRCEAAIADVVAGSADLTPGAGRRRAARARHPRPQLRGGHPPRPDPRRRPEVLPADLPRVLRAPLVRAGRRPARRARSRSPAPRCRSGPT